MPFYEYKTIHNNISMSELARRLADVVASEDASSALTTSLTARECNLASRLEVFRRQNESATLRISVLCCCTGNTLSSTAALLPHSTQQSVHTHAGLAALVVTAQKLLQSKQVGDVGNPQHTAN
jgi:hypothetical protein